MEVVRSPGSATMPNPHDDEAMVFTTFFDARLHIPSVSLFTRVLGIYQAEIA